MTVDTALDIVILAEDGLDAAIKTFNELVANTIHDHGNVMYIHKYCDDNYVLCANKINLLIINLKKINDLAVIKAFSLDHVIDELYRIAITPTRTNIKVINFSLKYLIRLAKIYRKIAVLARQYASGEPVLQKLIDSITDLHVEGSDIPQFSPVFKAEFKNILDRNHIMDLGNKIARIQQERVEDETKKYANAG